jgi:hypothetical protein
MNKAIFNREQTSKRGYSVKEIRKMIGVQENMTGGCGDR